MTVEAFTATQPPARSKPFTTVTWHSVDLRSGRRGSVVVTKELGSVSRILNEATETTIDVRIPTDPAQVANWQASTQPGLVMLTAVDQNDQPIWGGLVYRRVSQSSGWATLNLITLEAYLDRRYLNSDYTYTGADQVSEIAAGLIATTLANGIQFVIDAPFSNWRLDRTYLVDDDKTVLSVLQELAGIENGIEFTIDLQWADDAHFLLSRIIRVRNRVGTAYLSATGVQSSNPPSVFYMPGSVVDFEYAEDYSPENGANAIIAVSSGEGDDRPESLRNIAGGVVYGFGGTWPMYEMRFTPSTSITDQETLDDHAYAELQETWDGLNELTLEANLDVAPQVNVDWWIGDDIGVSLTCARFPERVTSEGERIPGYLATLRCIGWEIDFDARRVKPRLVELNEVEVETL